MAAQYFQSKSFNANINQIAYVIKDTAFSSELNLEFKSENPTADGVWFRFHHGATFTSWGEKITITLVPSTAGATRVEVVSECGMPTQVVDWGKNQQNVCNILEFVERNLLRASTANTYASANTSTYANTSASAPANVSTGVKYCINCGKQLPQDAAFCTNCGHKQP